MGPLERESETVEYSIYVLNPTTRYVRSSSSYADARSLARELVERHGYQDAEVCDPTRHVFAVWYDTDTGRIKESELEGLSLFGNRRH
jgi:hypothetical protein